MDETSTLDAAARDLAAAFGPAGVTAVAFADSSFLSLPEINDILVVTLSHATPALFCSVRPTCMRTPMVLPATIRTTAPSATHGIRHVFPAAQAAAQRLRSQRNYVPFHSVPIPADPSAFQRLFAASRG